MTENVSDTVLLPVMNIEIRFQSVAGKQMADRWNLVNDDLMTEEDTRHIATLARLPDFPINKNQKKHMICKSKKKNYIRSNLQIAFSLKFSSNT
jgi:hypothetical protein